MSTLDDTTTAAVFGITGDGPSAPVIWDGGWGTLIASGNFGSGTASIEADFGDGVWIPQRDDSGAAVTLDASSNLTFNLCKCRIRLVLADSTGADLKLWARPITLSTNDRYGG